MDVLKDDLLEAVGAVAAPLLLSAVARQLDSLGPVLTVEQAGGAIVSALCPETRFGPLGTKTLIGCDLVHDGEAVWLSAGECALHPGLSDWTPHSLAQAAMLPAEAAYTMAGACQTIPMFESVGVVIGEGLCSGQLALTFASGARAVAYYGQKPAGGLFSSTSHAISGDGLFEIGNRLRRSVNEAAALAAVAEAAPAHHSIVTVH